MFKQIVLLLEITRSHSLVRRYFVVNGFDGALTMLGMIMGFYISDKANLSIVVNSCLGAAIALGMSGLSSAYISESAEQKKELQQLEQAMLKKLDGSAYGQATRLLPFLIAAVNGLSPLLISFIIILPIWVATIPVVLPIDALPFALLLALSILFLLGVFLGSTSGTNWLWAGLRTLIIAAVTLGLIYFIAPS